jgi:hypothetical protein
LRVDSSSSNGRGGGSLFPILLKGFAIVAGKNFHDAISNVVFVNKMHYAKSRVPND